jgi:hypothetical protein
MTATRTRPPVDYDALIEDVQWMLDTREHPVNVARRLGRTVNALEKALRRAGRHDLARHFDSEQRAAYPREHNNTGRDKGAA